MKQDHVNYNQRQVLIHFQKYRHVPSHLELMNRPAFKSNLVPSPILKGQAQPYLYHYKHERDH